MKKIKIISVGGIIAIILVWGTNYFSVTNKSITQDKQPLAVQTVAATTKTITETYQTVARLEAKDFVSLSNGVAGQVNKIFVDAGAKVQKGQQLIALHPDSVVRAPFSGYLTDWKVKPGEYIAAGTSLIELVNKNKLTIKYNIPEKFAGKSILGQEVLVKIKAYPKEKFIGIVNFISPIVNKDTHSITIKALLDNPDQKLVPGSFTEIIQVLDNIPNALVIPEMALMHTLTGYEVYKIIDKKAIKTAVTLGVREKGRAEILSGLQQGDAVIIVHHPRLRDGIDVVATEWQGTW